MKLQKDCYPCSLAMSGTNVSTIVVCSIGVVKWRCFRAWWNGAAVQLLGTPFRRGKDFWVTRAALNIQNLWRRRILGWMQTWSVEVSDFSSVDLQGLRVVSTLSSELYNNLSVILHAFYVNYIDKAAFPRGSNWGFILVSRTAAQPLVYPFAITSKTDTLIGVVN